MFGPISTGSFIVVHLSTQAARRFLLFSVFLSFRCIAYECLTLFVSLVFRFFASMLRAPIFHSMKTCQGAFRGSPFLYVDFGIIHNKLHHFGVVELI